MAGEIDGPVDIQICPHRQLRTNVELLMTNVELLMANVERL